MFTGWNYYKACIEKVVNSKWVKYAFAFESRKLSRWALEVDVYVEGKAAKKCKQGRELFKTLAKQFTPPD